MHTKNYQNRAWFNKVIAKIKWCSLFSLTIFMQYYLSYIFETMFPQATDKQ